MSGEGRSGKAYTLAATWLLMGAMTPCVLVAAQDEKQLEPVVVIDRRLPETSSGFSFGVPRPPEETPWSAVSIASEGFGSADRVEMLAPLGAGLLPVSVSAQMDTGVAARGFEAARAYVDGLPDIRRRHVRDLSTVDRVEFLRGNATVSFGTGSPAGVLAYTLKPADGQDRRLARWTLGERDFLRGELDIGAALPESGGAYRFVMAAQNGEGDFDRVILDRRSLYGALSLPLGGGTRLNADFDMQQNDRPYAFGTVLQYGKPVYGAGYVGPATMADRRYLRGALRLEQPLSAQTALRLHVQSARVHREEAMHGFYTKISETQLSGYYTRFDDRVQQEDFLAELRGSERLGWGLAQWSAGLASSQANTGFGGVQNIGGFRLNIESPEFLLDPARLAMSPRYFRESVSERAVFARTDLEFGERWRFGLGLRRNLAEVDADRTGKGMLAQASLAATTSVLHALFKLAPRVSLWAHRGEGSDLNTGYDRFGSLLPHRRTRQIEAGVHWQAMERVTLRSAAYRLNQDNLPEVDPLDRNASVSSGERGTRGVEMEATLAWPGWRAVANAHWLAARVDSPAAGSVDLRPAGVPRHLGALAFFRILPLDRGTLELGARVWGMDRRAANSANTAAVAGFGRLDLSARWRLGSTAVMASLQNALDKRYVESVNSVADVYPGARRNFVLMLEHGF